LVTLKQIAALAGVSRGTVDRVLNNRGIVNPATAAKVLEIAESLNYRPNIAGKNLAVKKKKLKFGFILFGDNNPFFNDVVDGIQAKAAELEEYGVVVEIRNSDFDNHAHQVTLLDELLAANVDGIAITPVNHPLVAHKLQELASGGLPIVTVNTDIDGSGRLAYVGSNFRQSGLTAGELMGLITGGQAKVGIITGSSHILCHTERIAGFGDYLSENCPDVHLLEICENHDDDITSYSITRDLLIRKPEINALYLTAAGVYGACRAVIELNRQSSLRIISFDCVPTTVEMIKNGVIAATLGQQPRVQGSLPLDLLFNWVALGVKPASDKFYTEIEIKIKGNL